MRKEIEIKIDGNGRDAGKVFIVKEMPATQMDAWLTRAIGVLGADKTLLDVLSLSMSELILNLSKNNYDETKVLLDELLACCSFKSDNGLVPMKNDMVDGVIEDWTTIVRLKNEAFALNLGFFGEGGESTSK